MPRLSLDAEGLALSGWRARRWYYEDLRAARARDGALLLTRFDGREERIRLGVGEASEAADALSRILDAPPEADTPARLAERLAVWLEAPGFATVPLVDWLLRSAVACGASDLHLSPERAGATRLTMRIDGVLRHLADLARPRAQRVINRLKALAGLKLHRDDIPQEGRADLGEGHVRLGFTPGIAGEAVTIRLFDRLKGAARLGDLGFAAEAQATLAAWLRAPRGAVLFAGPSASGKTTTAYTALRARLAAAEGTLRAVTVEDPVEYRLADVVQLEADPGRGLTGPALLRAALRHDADVLMVGEVRDAESAALLVQAGMTGHLALGTIHAGDAAEAVVRLLNFGVSATDLVSVVRGIVGQRLVRLPCCAAGCARCGGTRYRGRRAVAELLAIDAIRQAITADHAALRAAAGLAPLATAADGITDAAEIERVFG